MKCPTNTVIGQDAKKCPECGAKIKMITSENGSLIPVNDKYVHIWRASSKHTDHVYENISGFMAHSYTCSAKDKFRNTRGKKD